MKFSGKSRGNFKNSYGGKSKSNKPVVKTRRELRKEERHFKKTSKAKSYLNRIKKSKEYYSNKKGRNKNKKDKLRNINEVEDNDPCSVSILKQSSKPVSSLSNFPKGNRNMKDEGLMIDKDYDSNSITTLECQDKPVSRLSDLSKESRSIKNCHKKLKIKMEKQRKRSLLQANQKEDMIISKLEKQLRLNQRKSKSLPSSFTSAGLDYILDVCNPDKMKNLADSEKYLQDSGSEFEDDLAVIKGQSIKKGKQLLTSDESFEGSEDNVSYSEDSDSDIDNERDRKSCDEDIADDDSLINDLEGDDSCDELESVSDDESIGTNTYLNSKISKNKSTKRGRVRSDSEESEPPNERPINRKPVSKVKKKVKLNKQKMVDSDGDSEPEEMPSVVPDGFQETSNANDNTNDDELMNDECGDDKDEDGTWEDIYGRTRDNRGNIVEMKKGKYVPPALRDKASSGDAKKREALERLKRQLKGLLNRLAETNMHGIANQIEELYMKNSRNDMNQTLIALYEEAIVSFVLTPERLIMEHAMLSAILHANIGSEVGAHILQTFVMRFDSLLKETTEVGDKRLDNLLAFICHLYTFKVFDNSLLYDILGILCDKFNEKEIELILVVLRNSGFSLRKDDPLALKDLVLRIQRLANQASGLKNDARVKFMLDVLLKIKNNNMSKLPQYDPSHSEHLKKLIKSMIRKGSYITELKISFQDLIKADERGRWWIVGSAWTGPSNTEQEDRQENVQDLSLTQTMSEQLLKLARKLRINTDVRKNIFCILMTAEDFEDAIEKLLKLGLKNQNMNEIIHVVLHCLIQEKDYNHYYSLIANRFSQIDRKYRMVVQYSLWDKFKEVDNMKPFQVTNLAKFLAFLFIEGTLPLSVLKVIQLVEMTKCNVRLIRQILLTILYNKDENTAAAVFLRLNKSPKLHLFREGLRLFLHHFLLKNVKETDEHYRFLKERITMADKALQPQST